VDLVLAPAGAISALTLMAALPWPTWRRLIVWFIVGMIVYFSYGVRRSNLARPSSSASYTGAGS
jgi:APA family basic amino acid/polyamine antiporter